MRKLICIQLILFVSFYLIYLSNIYGQSFTRITTGPIVNDGGGSGGGSWGDYDKDGNLDLFVANNDGENNFLYRNNGDGSFDKITIGNIVNDGGISKGSSWGDYDNDGNLDLFVTNKDGGNNFLYRNNGGGTFTKITSGAIVNDGGGSFGSGWGDYDNDGDLDLFVANTGEDNFLYRNNGDGTFTKITSGAIVKDGGASTSSSWGDYDNDGDLDLFVANESGGDNFLYRNNGGGTFTKITSGAIVNDGGQSLSGSWGDFDNDGDLDLFVANEGGEDNFLYQNNGDGTFSKITTGAIVNDGGSSVGSTWGDYDNDGDLDLFVTNIKNGNNFLYENNGDGTFTRITSGAIVTDDGESVGSSWGDYDNDGFLDLFVANKGNSNNFLYSNNGNSNNWINIKCVGTESNTSAIGAKMRVTATINGNSVEQLREISGQTGYLSQNSLNAEFGLGNATIIEMIKVEWPNGIVQTLTNVTVNQFLTIMESSATQPPNSPSKVVATVISSSQVDISWNDNSANETQFRIERKTGSGSFGFLANVGANITNYSDNSVSPNTSYQYRVRGENSAGNSGFPTSNTVTTDDVSFTRITSGAIVNDGGSSGGVGWGDYDDDGDLDLFVSNRDTDNFLYRNDGNGNFTRISSGAIVNDGGNSNGPSWGDYNNDGDIDLFVANFKTNDISDNFLYDNSGNSGTFSKITSGIIVNDNGSSFGGGWGDYDNDGNLDLFIANAGGQNNFLYRNNGNSSFTKITSGAIVTDGGASSGNSWGDYDNDNDLDLFVANDLENNFLYKNNDNGSFTRITSGDIANDVGASVGGSWGDYDNDGDIDLFVTNDEGADNFLYENDGNGTFARISTGVIVNDGGASAGSSWGDYDNDGDLDLFVTNIDGGDNFLYQNNGPPSFTFTKVTSGSIVTDGGASIGCAWADYDNDGDPDLAVANKNSQNNFLYRNNGSSNNWINIRCIGTESNTSAIGAKIRVTATINGNSVEQLREISGQTGYLSQNSLNAEFGLGNATIIEMIKVEWPGGIVQTLTNESVNQFLTITETNPADPDMQPLIAFYNSTDGPNWTDNSNWLSGQPVSTWFGVTVTGNRVSSLDLSNNNLNGSIPVEIGNLTELTTLELSGNQFSVVPTEITNLINLTTLNLSACNMGGTIPTQIGNLTNLKVLSLGANRIVGSIPPGIGSITALENLSLTANSLSGQIPPEIGNLSNLQSLSLTANDLSGVIPVEVGNLLNLRSLFLLGNKLSGQIPNEIGNLVNLGQILLSSNMLSGPIPSEIGNLKQLITLFLSNNNLSGAIPTELGDLGQKLLGLYIGDNEFSGALPQSFTNLTELQTFHFQNNVNLCIPDNAAFSSFLAGVPNVDSTGVDICSPAVDQVPPQISYTAVSEASANQSLTLSPTITDNIAVQSATLFYRQGGAGSYSSTNMTNTSGDIWQGAIPSNSVTERGVEYYFSAQDATGNPSTFPATNPQNNPQVVQVTSSNLTFSSPNLAYRMISVPIDLDNSLAASVLEDDLGSYDDTQWRLLRYISGNNVEFPSAGSFEPGRGFWLITRGFRTLGTGAGKSVRTAQNYVITLPPGWSQIGNPFAFSVNWSDVIKNGNVENQLVGYQGSSNELTGYVDRTQLEPFKGYFVNNLGGTTNLEIPASSATGMLAKRNDILPGIVELRDDEWALQITAQSDRFLDQDNYIGVLHSSEDTWDRNDFSEPPFFDSFVSLYFPHEDWQTYPGLYTGDFRSINSEGHYWDFHIKSNIANSEVVLTLTHMQNLPSETEVVLIDKASRISISLLEQDSYIFPSGEAGVERDFRIVVGKTDFVDSNDLNFSGIPETFILSQNYPNPFNPETNIDYELPVESEVKIAVFNLLGQQIRSLFNGQQNAGRYTVFWDGKSHSGLNVSSGLYLVRMQAGKFVTVRKVLLTK